MGKDGAYRGVNSNEVISDFRNMIKTGDETGYITVEWSTGKFNRVMALVF